EATLPEYAKHPDLAKRMSMDPPPSTEPLYPNPFKKVQPTALHQWGMSIDLTSCVGCSACAMACQSENNIPIVGKRQVSMGREMHWLRIDRYFSGNPAREKGNQALARDDQQQFAEWIDDPQVVYQPMLCQHCEAAP